MKQCRKAYWRALKAHLLALLLAGLALFGAATAWAAPVLNGIRIEREAEGPVIEFVDGDYLRSNSRTLPTTGWQRVITPNIYRTVDTNWRTGDYHTLWGRHRFDRAVLSGGELALYTAGTRNQFKILLNGREIFRNYATEGDQKLAWYRPYLAPIPENALRPGMNEIVIRAVSQDSVGIGRVLVGPHLIVENYYQWQYFWRVTAPMIASSAMLVLGFFAILLWLARRDERELLYLGISTGLWFLRNYQYFAEVTPFNLALFNALTVAATLLASVATFAFYITYIKVKHSQRIIAALTLLAIPWVVIHWAFNLSNFILYVPTIMLTSTMSVMGYKRFYRTRSFGDFVWPTVMFLMVLAGIYDARLAGIGTIWKGNDFYLALFNGFFYCLAFLLTFGVRALRAFTALSDANANLEKRIEETRNDLAASEAARQELQVSHAIAAERERLMQEMHDGIGSNLITALAVAEKQHQPPSTIKTLRRALNDLKITVDSLEPIEGDLIALIGNLRHRMTADLRDAGVTCKWEVKPCGNLPWLDATNALHVLRIFQEAIGNVLTHSGASILRIGCREEAQGGVPGIATYVADNGRGFDVAHIDDPGKGLNNITARARSLHGTLTCESDIGQGTIITLWLPYERAMPFRAG